MQITNVTDLPDAPGAARATFEDGSTMVVPRSQLPPQLGLASGGATAQNMSVGPTTSDEFAAKWGGPTPSPQQASDVSFSTPPAAQSQAPRPIMVQSQGDVGGEYQAQQVPMDPRQLEIQRLRSPYKYVPGTPGFDPTAEAARRRAVPVSQTVQTSGARAYDPEALRDAQDLESKALEAQAEGNMLQANAKLQADRVMHAEVSNLYRQQQAEQQAREAEFASKQASLDAEAKAVAAREVDPNRVFKNMSVFQTLGLAIAAGLKGAATQGRDTSIQDSLMHRMDADIRAQEHDIATSKGHVDNALARLSQQYGSIQAGKAALKDQQLSVIMAKTTATASEIGTAIAKANAQAANLKLQAEQAKLREQRWSEAQGQTSTAVQSAMMSPRAATRGGVTYKSDAERLKGWEAADKLAENQATTEGKQLTNLEKRRELTGAGAAPLSKETAIRKEHLGQALGEVASLRTAVDQIISRGGITEDEKGNAKHGDIPGVGMGYNAVSRIPFFGEQLANLAASTVGGPDAATVRAQAQEALTYKIKEASGAAFSEAEAKRHAQALGQAFLAGEDQFAQSMVNFRRAIEEKEQSLRAGAGTEASRSYDADKAQLRQEAAASKAGIRGTYRGTVTE